VTYQSIVVYLDLEQTNESVLRITSDLAENFKSRVIGITAAFPNMPIHSHGKIGSSVRDADYEELKQAIARCESRFHATLEIIGNSSEWRSDAAYPADFLAAEARAADLLIVGWHEKGTVFLKHQSLDIGDAVMKAGRPILVVPPRKTSLALNCVLIAWKDTAQARRAISAALPLLKRAQSVMIVEIVADDREIEAATRRVADVAKWLQSHKVTASASAELSCGDDGSHLDAIASESGVDVIVAGAYGHGRLREWTFGGVTSHLLHRSSMFAFLMH
jgi:nucleotide-binding universal stress UspA family protein